MNTMDTSSDWIRSQGIPRHSGSSIPADLDFFTSPPPEIGKVISADSSLTRSKQPMSITKRVTISLLVGLGIAFVLWLFMGRPNFSSVDLTLILMAVVVLAGIITYSRLGFAHWCSYVGDQGIVEFKLQGSRSGTKKTNLLLFKDAANLFTKEVRNYRNRVYTGTNYTYRWTKISDQPYALIGYHYSEKRLPPDGDAWYFANAAEAAWTHYLLQMTNEQFARLGYVEFPLSGSLKAIRIGSGFLEFVLKNDTIQRAAVSDMKDIRLGSGVFQFTHKDARWWSGQGKYSFTYADIPNANLFLLCLKHLTNISWQ